MMALTREQVDIIAASELTVIAKDTPQVEINVGQMAREWVKMREALEFYARQSYWNLTARQALADINAGSGADVEEGEN